MEYLTYEEFEQKVYEIDSPISLRIDEDLNRKALRVVKADNRFGEAEALVEIDKEHQYCMVVQPSVFNQIPSWRKELEGLSWRLAGTPVQERSKEYYYFPWGKDVDDINVYAVFGEHIIDDTCLIRPVRTKVVYSEEEISDLIEKYPYLESFISQHKTYRNTRG
ncbi:hypothetical protein [Limosilactobacillus reuteri]|uniref:hypothetical protein n=1 Tax=Limosilactobacillus reuteri TaxID=1598 RepID=UPI001C5B2D4C|nr:hypothetical protein [Limosilactobacillus reuteri]MBW3350680.1 hypothetical protein [Limosilactobacillus reuteri]UUW69722.1 hypothetical protein NUJ10_11835 [Limosilactobacillus reuteri]